MLSWWLITAANAMLIPQFAILPELDSEFLDIQGSDESLPLITSEDITKRVSADALRARAERLYKCAEASIPEHGHPTRVIGSEGHKRTLEYIYDTLGELDDFFDVKTEALTSVSGVVRSYSLQDSSGNVTCKPFSLTPSSNGPVKGEVFKVENFGCKGSDFKGTEGKIALVKRGKCPFGEKSEFAGLFDAKAVLIYDPEDDEIISGDLGLPLGHQVATLGVPKAWAESFESGDVEVDVDAFVKTIDTVNVIAETKTGDHDNVVMIGSHSDSVFAGPGMNDNGSGLNTLLELATLLPKYRITNAVRLAWWTAEEEGLIGSLHYAQNLPAKENRKIRLFLDYDMMASRNHAFEIYDSDDKVNPKGSSAIRDMYIDFFQSRDLNYTLQPFDGRSDYVGFLDIGVPAGGVDAGVEEIKTPKQQEMFGGKAGVPFDKCYHLACDDLDNLDYETWQIMAEMVMHSAAVYANSLEGFPEREVFMNSVSYRKPKSDRV